MIYKLISFVLLVTMGSSQQQPFPLKKLYDMRKTNGIPSNESWKTIRGYFEHRNKHYWMKKISPVETFMLSDKYATDQCFSPLIDMVKVEKIFFDYDTQSEKDIRYFISNWDFETNGSLIFKPNTLAFAKNIHKITSKDDVKIEAMLNEYRQEDKLTQKGFNNYCADPKNGSLHYRGGAGVIVQKAFPGWKKFHNEMQAPVEFRVLFIWGEPLLVFAVDGLGLPKGKGAIYRFSDGKCDSYLENKPIRHESCAILKESIDWDSALEKMKPVVKMIGSEFTRVDIFVEENTKKWLVNEFETEGYSSSLWKYIQEPLKRGWNEFPNNFEGQNAYCVPEYASNLTLNPSSQSSSQSNMVQLSIILALLITAIMMI